VDGSGNGVNLAPGGGGTAPTFRLDDDLLPYISFDGVTNNLQNLAVPNGVGVIPKTLYSVIRCDVVAGTANAKCITLLRAGTVAGAAAGTARIAPDAGKRFMLWAYGGVLSAAVALPQDGTSVLGGVWIINCVRAGFRGNPQLWWNNYFQQSFNGYGVRYPLGWPAWNYDRLGVGGQADSAPFASDFARMDIRMLALYPVCHSDFDVKQNMRFLAHKWKVAVLD
jgi:hypothetical protein